MTYRRIHKFPLLVASCLLVAMETNGDFDTPLENKQYPLKCRFDKYENTKFGKTSRDRWMESLKEEEEEETEDERSEVEERW